MNKCGDWISGIADSLGKSILINERKQEVYLAFLVLYVLFLGWYQRGHLWSVTSTGF